jgi:hypothetical protein
VPTAFAPRSFILGASGRPPPSVENEFDANPRRPVVVFLPPVARPGGVVGELCMRRQAGEKKLDLNIRLYAH